MLFLRREVKRLVANRCYYFFSSYNMITEIIEKKKRKENQISRMTNYTRFFPRKKKRWRPFLVVVEIISQFGKLRYNVKQSERAQRKAEKDAKGSLRLKMIQFIVMPFFLFLDRKV